MTDLFAAALAREEARGAMRVAVAAPGAPPLEWGVLAARVEATANALLEAGAVPGERIGWLGANDPGQLVLLAACARIGAVKVPLNWRLAADELRWIEHDAGLSRLVVAEGSAHPYLDRSTLPRHDPADLAGAEDGDPGLIAPPPDAPLLLCYTSGTSGRPKGAVMTHAAVAAHAGMSRALFGLTRDDRVLTVLPLFHLGGLNIQTVPALLAGTTVLLHPRFDAELFFNACERDRPTLTLLVPAVMAALVAHPRWREADLSSLRAVGAGSCEVPLPLIAAFNARGIPVQQVYGATETGPIAIAQTPAEAWAEPGCIGRPVPGVEARLDPDGALHVRSAALAAGYWNATDATASAFQDGWFATGDAARVDADGRWWFAGRIAHRIISGGENIDPTEVERVLREAPGVADGAVCGRPDLRWGEVPVAVVVPGPGFDASVVLRHFEGRLARFKHPRDVVVVDALPRTALGKVQLAALRAIAAREAKTGE